MDAWPGQVHKILARKQVVLRTLTLRILSTTFNCIPLRWSAGKF